MGLEQSKARHLPLHLHQCQLTVPGVRGQWDLTISCGVARFFTSSLQRLKISPEKAGAEAQTWGHASIGWRASDDWEKDLLSSKNVLGKAALPF